MATVDLEQIIGQAGAHAKNSGWEEASISLQLAGACALSEDRERAQCGEG